MPLGCIYAVVNRVSGKRYVGKTTRPLSERLREHAASARRGSPLALHRAMRRHGFDAFSVEVLEEAEAHRLEALEVEWIRRLGAADSSRGYNMTGGGDGFSYIDPEMLARRNASILAKNRSPEVRARISAGTRAAFAARPDIIARRAATLSVSSREPEANARLRAKATARMSSPDVRARISAATKANWADPEFRARINAAREAAMTPEVQAKRLAAIRAFHQRRAKRRPIATQETEQ